jgi:2-polyprenyl-3-methyl-5-hydroxy-6-metoxy-1,4-benzoquinol methylase
MDLQYSNYALNKGWLNTLFQYSVTENAIYSKCIGKLNNANGANLLDVGFGSGSLLAWAQSNGYSISGIEVQSELVDEAKKRGICTYDNCNKVPGGSQDVITMFDLLEHLDGTEINKILGATHAALKPGGLIIIRAPNCQSPLGLKLQFGDHTHKTMLSSPILESHLSLAGFKEIFSSADYEPSKRATVLKSAVAGVQVGIRKVMFLSARILFSYGNTPLTSNILVRAKK